MKKLIEVANKITSLQKELSKQEIVENFGEKEQRKLDTFIGDIYEYPYQERLNIQTATKLFASWCMDYTGGQ